MFEKLFVPAPFFFIRSAAEPQETAEKLLAESDWVKGVRAFYDREPRFQEALAIASSGLHEMVKTNKEVAASLFKYAIRMAKRATPFGLFSFVVPAEWAGETQSFLEEQKIKKRVRPDMAWLLTLLQEHCQNQTIFPDLSVSLNQLVQRKGDRYVLSYIRYPEFNETQKNQVFSIRASKLVSAIFELTRKPKTVSVLCSELLVQMPQLELEKTETIIQQLLSQQFLLPSLFPSLLTDSPFHDLLPHLLQKPALTEISEDISTYEKIALGEGTQALSSLKDKMRSTKATTDLLQVDAYYDGTMTLPASIGTEMCEAAAYMWALSPRKSTGSAISVYHERFLEKYGTHRTVPLMELLNEERGLGSFSEERKAHPSQPIRFKVEWEQWLFQQWEEAIAEGGNEIVLPENLPSQLLAKAEEKPADPRDGLVSMDLFFKISARAQEDINQGEYLLEFVQPSWHGASALGRFFYLLNDTQKEHLRNYYSAEEKLEEGTLFLEVSCWPQTGRNANVSNHPCLRKHRLDLHDSSGMSYSLDDLYVGSTGQRFYLTLREGGREVVYRTSNFLNIFLMPDPIQLLREISLSRYQLFHPLSWGPLENKAAFLPRLRYKKTVLMPARWNLDTSLVSGKDWEKKFTAWADRWALPKRSFIVHEDHHLLFDRDHPGCLRELEPKINKQQPIQFFEEISQSWLRGAQGSYLAEITLPVLKNPLHARNQTCVPLPYKTVSETLRRKMPGDGWWYLKVYLAETEVSSFLKNQVIPLAQEGHSFFFIRYADPRFHLRLRFRADVDKRLFEELNQRASQWLQQGLVQDIAWVPYEREVERYGGPDLIDLAEDVFCEDSIQVLKKIGTGKEKSPVAHTLSGLQFLREFSLTEPEIKHLLEIRIGSSEALAGFRQWKTELLAQSESILSETSPDPVKSAFRSACSALAESDFYDICNSMLHIHFNRLGCSVADEERARQYALSVLLQRERKLIVAAVGVTASY